MFSVSSCHIFITFINTRIYGLYLFLIFSMYKIYFDFYYYCFSEKNTIGLFWLNAAETWVDIGSNIADKVSFWGLFLYTLCDIIESVKRYCKYELIMLETWDDENYCFFESLTKKVWFLWSSLYILTVCFDSLVSLKLFVHLDCMYYEENIASKFSRNNFLKILSKCFLLCTDSDNHEQIALWECKELILWKW